MSIRQIINDNKVAILDGGFGSTISSEIGIPLDPILFASSAIVDHPDAVIETHSRFLKAGADITTTSSYQVSYDGFHKKYPDFQEMDTFHIYQQSIDLAKQAIINSQTSSIQSDSISKTLVAASIGCYGAHLADGSEYIGRYSVSIPDLMIWHRKQLIFLLQSNANIIAMETIPCLDEIKAFVHLLNEDVVMIPPHVSSIWLSFACNSSSTMNSGDNIEDAIRYIEDNLISNPYIPVDISVNCTAPEYVEDIIHLYDDICSSHRVKIAYPNTGELWDAERHAYITNEDKKSSDESIASYAVRWYDAGARVIGGCCRCTPHTIYCIKHQLLPHISS